MPRWQLQSLPEFTQSRSSQDYYFRKVSLFIPFVIATLHGFDWAHQWIVRMMAHTARRKMYRPQAFPKQGVASRPEPHRHKGRGYKRRDLALERPDRMSIPALERTMSTRETRLVEGTEVKPEKGL